MTAGPSVTRQRRRAGQATDEGSALLMVLVLLTILAFALGAMFAQAGANLVTSTVVAGQDNKVFAADGGVDMAIQWLRADAPLYAGCQQGTVQLLGPAPTIDGLVVGLTCEPSGTDVAIHATAPDTCQCPLTSTAVISIASDPTRAVTIVSWVTVHQ